MKLLVELLGSFRGICFIILIVLVIKPAEFSLLSDFSFTFLSQEIHLPGYWVLGGDLNVYQNYFDLFFPIHKKIYLLPPVSAVAVLLISKLA